MKNMLRSNKLTRQDYIEELQRLAGLARPGHPDRRGVCSKSQLREFGVNGKHTVSNNPVIDGSVTWVLRYQAQIVLLCAFFLDQNDLVTVYRKLVHCLEATAA